MKKLFFPILISICSPLFAQTTATITVDATQNISAISPWLYGRNNNISDDPSSPVSGATWQMYKDAGLRFYRENGGNNCTKYNWRLKLTSHPDWYNNVYTHNWDYSANSLLTNTSGTQGLYAFQLLGKVASNKTHNFNDWAYSQDVGYNSPANNWAGGGGAAKYGGNGGVGDASLYLQDWPADSTAGILDHWFNTLGYDSTRLQYWNMDNEPDIWYGTHDDIATAVTAEQYMQKYFAVAKAVRKKHPFIKIVGPAFANEWTWFNWNNNLVKGADNKDYTLIEYFIKRIGEEQTASGLKLLDVLDVHFYPGTSGNPDLNLQIHKIWFDSTWVYSGANGVKRTGKWGWDGTITKEYFFERCNQWMNKYIGVNHGVKFGIGEYGQIATNGSEDANVIACWYASHLGTFANKGVEFFTPWDWYRGQWEVLHLFSNYYGTFATKATSSLDDVVSGYSSLSNHGDTLIVVLVNKDKSASRTSNVNIQNFTPSGSNVEGYQLANLSASTETFVSKSNNALQSKQYTVSGNQISLSLPKLSVTLLRIPTNSAVQTSYAVNENTALKVNVFPNPAQDQLQIQVEKEGAYTVAIHNMLGQKMGEWNSVKQIDISSFAAGNYIVQIRNQDMVTVKKVVKN